MLLCAVAREAFAFREGKYFEAFFASSMVTLHYCIIAAPKSQVAVEISPDSPPAVTANVRIRCTINKRSELDGRLLNEWMGGRVSEWMDGGWIKGYVEVWDT